MNLLIRLRICCRDIKFAACGFICACRYDIGFSLSFFSTTFHFILAPCHVPKNCGVRYRMYTYTSLVFGENWGR